MKKDKTLAEDHITKILNNPKKVTKIIQDGIKQALLNHKKAGNTICAWIDNKVVWIPPEKISVK